MSNQFDSIEEVKTTIKAKNIKELMYKILSLNIKQ